MKTDNKRATVHSLEDARLRSHDNQLPENNRAQYERIAEALATLCEIEYGPFDEGADMGDLKKRPIMKGVEQHMLELFKRADFADPRTIRRFYAELRLWADEVQAEEDEGAS